MSKVECGQREKRNWKNLKKLTSLTTMNYQDTKTITIPVSSSCYGDPQQNVFHA